MTCCAKRRYHSVEAAKRAHRRAGWRLRPYWCSRCGGYHVSNAEKRTNRRVR